MCEFPHGTALHIASVCVSVCPPELENEMVQKIFLKINGVFRVKCAVSRELVFRVKGERSKSQGRIAQTRNMS